MGRYTALARPVAAGLAVFSGATGTAIAHAGSIEAATSTPPVPTWFVVLSAGIVVGSSFLFTSLMADHEALRFVNRLGLRRTVPSVSDLAPTAIRLGALAAVAGIALAGLFGPTDPQENAATLSVWVGWWGGFTVTTYAIGNSWPLVNPFRLVAAAVPRPPRFEYPAWLGVWPAVAGLFGIVWLEVATAVSANPRLLAGIVGLYALATVAGVLAVGERAWFDGVDPISRVFGVYGRLAPVQRTADGLALRLPGAALTDLEVTRTPGLPAFVVALLWSTTFDGMVSTPTFQAVAGPLFDLGVPPAALYLVVLLAGFGVFYQVYRAACRRSRSAAGTYVTSGAIERWFAPSLIPIAAGYHVAHFLGYVVSLAPALLGALGSPIAGPASITVLVLPEWFGLLQLGFVILGHLLAIWVAHSIAFELFPGVRQPIRSQYPMILVMIGYTMVSAWVIVSPATTVVLG